MPILLLRLSEHQRGLAIFLDSRIISELQESREVVDHGSKRLCVPFPKRREVHKILAVQGLNSFLIRGPLHSRPGNISTAMTANLLRPICGL